MAPDVARCIRGAPTLRGVGRTVAVSSKLGWKVTALAFAVPLGFAARKAVAAGWRAVRHDDPPEHHDYQAGWTETLVWAALSGVAIAAAELLAARGAAAAWRSLTGSEPPGQDDADGDHQPDTA
jgi:hypothetical protein